MTSIIKVDELQDTSGNLIIKEDSNTITIGASGDTISIPSGATITNSGTATGFGGGKVGQILNTSSTPSSTTSSDVELFNLSITPSATSSKILAIVNVTCQLDGNEYTSFDLYRGTLSSRTKVFDAGEALFNSADVSRFSYGFTYLDSPSTTSATQYTVVGSPHYGTITYSGGGKNTITLIEVLA